MGVCDVWQQWAGHLVAVLSHNCGSLVVTSLHGVGPLTDRYQTGAAVLGNSSQVVQLRPWPLLGKGVALLVRVAALMSALMRLPLSACRWEQYNLNFS